MPYLLKTEPKSYSFDQLVKDKETIWDGVKNPVALKNMAAMRPGDELVIYHTGDVRTVVGMASVVSVDAKNPSSPVVRIKAGKPVHQPHTLAEIKANPLFSESPLLRQGRLSVVPLNVEQYKWLVH